MGVNPLLDATDARRRLGITAALELAWRGNAFTASDLMDHTGGTRATSLALCTELIRRRWLTELENCTPSGQGGRPARQFRLDPAAALAVGVDAGAHRLIAVAVDALGEQVGRVAQDIEAAAPQPQRRAAVRSLVEQLVHTAGATRHAVCIGVPAPVDDRGRSPRGFDQFWQVMNPDYPRAFESGDTIVTIDNDANLAAFAERTIGGARDCDWFAAILAGSRLGAGLYVDGRLLRGFRGMAGELGFLDYVIDVGSSEGLGSLAERRAAEAARQGVPIRVAGGGVAVTSEEVLAAAGDGDVLAQRFVDELALRLARIAAVLGDAVGIQRLIVAGALPDRVDLVLDRAAQLLPEDAIGEPPQIVASTLGGDAVALGAAHRALASVRERALDTLHPRPRP